MSWGQEPPDRDREPAPGADQPSAHPGGRGSDPIPGDGRGWGADPGPDRLRPLNLGDVLDGMFRLVRTHWRAFALGLGVIVVPLALLTGLVVARTLGTPPGFLQLAQNPELAESFETGAPPSGGDIARVVGIAGLAGLAGVLAAPLIYGVAVRIAATAYRTGRVDPMASLREAAGRYLPLLGATILLWLIPAVIFLLPVIILIAGGTSGVDALVAIGGIAFIVTLVLALLAVVRLLLTIPVVVLEGAGPIRAVQRSNELVKGKTGLVLGTAIVVWIITTIIGIVLTLPFGLFGGAFGSGAGAVANTVGQMVSSLVTDSLLGAALVLIYFDRRVRSEGYDLSELADELGERPDNRW